MRVDDLKCVRDNLTRKKKKGDKSRRGEISRFNLRKGYHRGSRIFLSRLVKDQFRPIAKRDQPGDIKITL